VLKPSEFTSLSALEMAAIATRVGLPKGVLNIVTGYGAAAGGPLVEHPLVKKVSFTGSVATGARIAAASAKDIKKCTLELGGKSPIIVFPDADLDQAIDWVCHGILLNAGQVCCSTSRLIVHEDVKEKVLSRVIEIAKKVKLGPGLDPSTKVGPVVNGVQFDRISHFIKSGIAEGAKLVIGGLPAQSEGFFIPPTIFDNVKPNMTIWREEIFGPVLSVMTFKGIDEAISLANNTNFGLAAAVMSQDNAICDRLSKELEAGTVWVNCSQASFIELPWGGFKQSGIGRELGPWGLEGFLEAKEVARWSDQKRKGYGWFTADA